MWGLSVPRVLLRLVDDFLLVTPHLTRARDFLIPAVSMLSVTALVTPLREVKLIVGRLSMPPIFPVMAAVKR